MAMQQNNIVALRETLFETLRSLSSKENPMDIDRAKAICDTSQTIINSVKVEIDFAKVTGLQVSSNFIPAEITAKKEPVKLSAAPKEKPAIQPLPIPYGISNPAPGVIVHRAK